MRLSRSFGRTLREAPADAELVSHQTIGVIESVKAVSDVYSPISGKVLEVNSGLNDAPETLNQDPHGRGWILKLAIKDKSELDQLLSALDYEKFVEGLGA